MQLIPMSPIVHTACGGLDCLDFEVGTTNECVLWLVDVLEGRGAFQPP